MKSSGTKTSSGIIMACTGRFFGILVTPDGTNAVTITIYDASAASGKKITTTLTFAGNGGSQTWQPPIEAVECLNGIYANVSVAGGGTVEYIVYFEEGY